MMIRGVDYKEVTYTKEQVEKINSIIDNTAGVAEKFQDFIIRCAESGIEIDQSAMEPGRKIVIKGHMQSLISMDKIYILGVLTNSK